MRAALKERDWEGASAMFTEGTRARFGSEMASGDFFIKRDFIPAKAMGISKWRQPFPPEMVHGPIEVQGNSAAATFREPIPPEMRGTFQTELYIVRFARELGRWCFLPRKRVQ